MQGALAECVVRSHLCPEPCRSCGIQPSMHLLWRKNTKPRPKQLRHTRLALHESDLSAKLCHRSELPGRNQSPDAVEEAGLSSAGVRRWHDNTGGERRSPYLPEPRRELVSKQAGCTGTDRTRSSVRREP